MISWHHQQLLTRIIAILGLILLLGVGTIPGYLGGHWKWQEPPAVISLKKLKQIRHQGLTLPGWPTKEQNVQEIGEHQWSVQKIQQQGSQVKAVLLLLPQNGPTDQPEVEWTDIDGWANSLWRNWQISQFRVADFTVKQLDLINSHKPYQVKARFFRGTTQQNTFAVLQWYAMPNLGDISPGNWFIADQIAQWRQQRVPWVAVSILIPMEPLGQVEDYWTLARSLGEIVQVEIVKAGF